ncbi:aminodeoxychorismate/anthranilate synthase component II (plasmid) [Buchnera aphidicola (Pseudoregma panicola)]|uniref:aminodeoxychorismate/anthranilate synthase component II n=1 Tax=Buchnera aphidicola TaxID=9 RepID=UPI0031B71722
MSNIFILDNIDSFTNNISEQLKVLGNKVIICRNDESEIHICNVIKNFKDSIILFSPGPGTPLKSGCMMNIIKKFNRTNPMLGICLGHQAIIEFFGGSIKLLKKSVHGKYSNIVHDNKFMFNKIANPLKVSRYHSWTCNEVPRNFIVNSYYKEKIMSLRSRKHKICSFQFHPESILTPFGNKLIENTINWLSK